MDTRYAALPSTHQDVLYLLAIGARRLDIARDLCLSVRTVDQRVAEIKRILGASERFSLGVGAIRRREIDPAYVISHASARRTSLDWIPPTRRQYEILRLRADGAPINEVANKIGLSTSGVRHHFAQLAADNGACTAVNAGALFEALGWTWPA